MTNEKMHLLDDIAMAVALTSFEYGFDIIRAKLTRKSPESESTISVQLNGYMKTITFGEIADYIVSMENDDSDDIAGCDEFGLVTDNGIIRDGVDDEAHLSPGGTD